MLAPSLRLIELGDRRKQTIAQDPALEPDTNPGWPYNNMSYFAALSHQFAETVEGTALREGPPDVIECQDYAAIGYFLLQRRLTLGGPLKGVPVQLHIHTPDYLIQKWNQYPRWKLPDYWIGRMERASLWMADHVVAPSQAIVDAVEVSMEGTLPQVDIVPYPLTFQFEDDQATIAPEVPLLVYAGRIELRKGVEPLIKACEQLWNTGEEFQLQLVGGDVHIPLRGGSYTRWLQERYEDRITSGQIRLTGNLSHEDCLDRMRSATAIALPSLYENFPNTCMEAMALGKVVVASSNGGMREMIDDRGQSGFLADPNNVPELAETLKKALHLDPGERIRMGNAARRRIHEICEPGRVLKTRIARMERLKPRHGNTFPFLNRRLREGPRAEPLPEKPLISVLIPYYNLGNYLGECVASVMASKGVQLEVIIINDGSTDTHSIEKLDDLRRENLPQVKILDIPNGGLANARNVGAREATGELIAFVDADDCVEPTFFARALELFQRYNNVHLAYSWVRFFDGGRGIWHSWTFDLPYLLCHNQLIPIVVLRRESFLAAGQNKPHIVYGLEDLEGWISMAEAGYGGVSIPEALTRYRIRPDSMFKAIEWDRKLYLYDLISAEHPEVYTTYGRELFDLQNANGPSMSWDQPTMFRCAQDRLFGRLERAEARSGELHERVRSLEAAEKWLHKERRRLAEKAGEILEE
jgi:glycogen(starch) synthase